MSEPIDAIYDHGVLRPLMLPDQARVKVTIDAQLEGESAEETAGQNEVTRDGGASEGGDAGADFNAKLDALLFDGPTLPPDFSRADIYTDHD